MSRPRRPSCRVCATHGRSSSTPRGRTATSPPPPRPSDARPRACTAISRGLWAGRRPGRPRATGCASRSASAMPPPSPPRPNWPRTTRPSTRSSPISWRPICPCCNGSTGTTTSGRCSPSTKNASSSSTSKANPCAHWPSASCPTSPSGTSPGCCAPSTTPQARSPASWARPRPATAGGTPRRPPSATATTRSRDRSRVVDSCCGPSSWTRPSTRSPTRRAAARPGSRSR
jgi:hypothetical protein